MEDIEDIQEKELELKHLHQRVDSEFYIDPDGRIIKSTLEEAKDWISLHLGIAERLYPDVEHADDYLFEMGWISIGSAAYGIRIKSEPTQSQIDTLYELGYRRIRDSFGIMYEF
jgi:hypothetical protein